MYGYYDEYYGTYKVNHLWAVGEWGPYNAEIVDTVVIPTDIAPGKYVLNWRLDCEESNQIWQVRLVPLGELALTCYVTELR